VLTSIDCLVLCLMWIQSEDVVLVWFCFAVVRCSDWWN